MLDEQCHDGNSHSVSRFEARAEAAWEHYQATGESVSATEFLAKLQAKLDAKRQLLVNRAPRLG